jgi:hypothetical protein
VILPRQVPTPKAWATSQDEIEFFELEMSHMAGSHMSNPIGESSKMVPTLTKSSRVEAVHFQMRRVVRKECSKDPRWGRRTRQ